MPTTLSTVEILKEENSQLKAQITALEKRLTAQKAKEKDYLRAIASWRKSARLSDTLRAQIISQISVLMPTLAIVEKHFKKKSYDPDNQFILRAIDNLRNLCRNENL